MSTTVTNTNPITITGGTMAAGARATIYPNQIKRGFKVTAVQLNCGNNVSSVIIKDNSSVNNVLCSLNGAGLPAAGGPVIQYFNPPVEWADWAVTTLTNASDTVFVYIK